MRGDTGKGYKDRGLQTRHQVTVQGQEQGILTRAAVSRGVAVGQRPSPTHATQHR
jgi:hypothetical protein